MKILYHHRTASKDGQAVHIEEMISALRGLGHEVKVVAPAAGDDETLGAEVGWVQRLKRVLPKALYELLELSYSLLAYSRMLRAAREFGPDVIYERYNLFLVAGVMLKRRLSIPLLLEVNSPLAQERGEFGGLGMPWLARWVEGVVWRNANYVLPVTRVLAGHIFARGVPESRVAVIPNGINEAHFANAPSPSAAKEALGCTGDLVLGFTGFVRDWHGVDRVIHWMATKDAPSNARLLIVGDGPVRLDLERLADDLALGDRVQFTGILPRSKVPEYVAAFDIALQPAVVPYASPLKLFEYLALGKAVVAPCQPNIEEVLTDGENALLFESTVSEALEVALTRLCSDDQLRAHIGANAAATIARNGLTWNMNAQRVTALAEQAINAPLPPPSSSP
jgi:glycosyltransferase involved in cell wall biosynthesis